MQKVTFDNKKRKKKKNKVFDFIFCLIAVLIIIGSFMFIKMNKAGEQTPIFGYRFFSVLSGSMEPTIKTGSVIIVKESTPDQIHKGDIITFKAPNSNNIVTHRVNKVIRDLEGFKFETKGDANNAADPALIQKENIVGKTVKWIPKVGKVVQSIKSLFN